MTRKGSEQTGAEGAPEPEAGPAAGSPPAAPGSAASARETSPGPTPDRAASRDDGAPEDEHDELHFLEEEEHGSGLAGTLLLVLVTALAAGAGALWAAPRIAPHLPQPVAQYLVAAPPALESDLQALEARMDAREEAVDARLAAIEERLDSLDARVAEGTGEGTLPTRVAGLAERVESAEAIAAAASESTRRMEVRVTAAAETASAAAQRATVAEQRAAGAIERTEDASNAIADAERRLDAIETRLASAREEMRVVADALATTPEDAGGRRLDALVQSLRARIDGLEAARVGQPQYLTRQEARSLASQETLSAATTDLAARAGALASEIDALRREAAATRAELSADLAALSRRVTRTAAAKSEAVAEAEAALSAAAFEGSRAALSARLMSGAPYEEALADFAQISGVEPPPALTERAGEGHAALPELRRRLTVARRAAVAAQAEAEVAERGPLGRLSAWARRFFTDEPPADGAVPEVRQRFDRIDAHLARGDAAAALAESAGLPAPAREAVSGWLSELERRVEAERALDSYLARAGVMR